MRLLLKGLLSKAIDNLDITLAALGCVLAIPLTIYLHSVLRDPVYTPIGIIVFLTFLAYLLIRHRSSASVRPRAETTPRIYLLLNVLFFSLLTYSILAFHLRPDLYIRPLGYFIALSAMAAVLAIEIVFLPPRKSAAYFALFKIIIIGLSLVWSLLLLYPTVVGEDPWYHQQFTLMILDAGHVPAAYAYSGLPGMHLVIGATSLITGLDYKIATMFSVSLLQVVCNTLFIFLLGKFIHSARAGLLAALLLGVADWHLNWAYATIPNGMAVVFISITIYLLFKLRQESPKRSICLAVLTMAALMVTHTIGPAMLTILLLFMWLGAAIHKRLRYQALAGARIFLVAAILFAGVTLTYSTFVSGEIGRLTSLGQLFSETYVTELAPPEEPPSESVSAVVAQYRNHVVPASEHLFNNLGFFLFCALAVVGAFATVSREARNRYSSVFITAGLLILAVNFFVILPFQAWLTGRFNHFLQVLLAIPLGIAFLWLAGLPGKKIASASLTAAGVFILSFLMVMSPQLNLDNRTFSPNTIVRYAFTQSEVRAFDTASTFYDGPLGIDGYGERPLALILASSNNISRIDTPLVTGDYGDYQDTLILIRREVVVAPFRVFGGCPYHLDYDPREALTEQGFSKVYDCSSISGFIR